MKVGLWIALLFSAVTLVKCRPNDDIEHPTADKGHHDHKNEDVEYESDAEPEENGHPHSAAIEGKDLKKNTLHSGSFRIFNRRVQSMVFPKNRWVQFGLSQGLSQKSTGAIAPIAPL